MARAKETSKARASRMRKILRMTQKMLKSIENVDIQTARPWTPAERRKMITYKSRMDELSTPGGNAKRELALPKSLWKIKRPARMRKR